MGWVCAVALAAAQTTITETTQTTETSETTQTSVPDVPDVYATHNRVSCAVGADLHGMICKLIFTKVVGVEVVCTCHRACNSSGFGAGCAEYWGHEIQRVVEEDTGCTDYTSQLSVPGYWSKCRPKSNPKAPPTYYVEPDTSPTEPQMLIQSKEDPTADEAASFPALETKKGWTEEQEAEAELLRQIDQLKEQNEALQAEKESWKKEKELMMKENHELPESNAKMVDQVHTAKQDALKVSSSFKDKEDQAKGTQNALMPGETSH